ncbi:MAG: ATP synthase F0 subunit A [Deltaproteobacteria bacterium CG11_big_fil_rev_8_21_14_0_20_49_13]|nr:MAG: ATP synthase F0 subunit A [Deltaproteobacteria bacterium CG11_big_fil_rev_8_21_14_0_20_49_13]
MHEFNIFIWLGEKISFLSWIKESTMHIATAALVAIVLIALSFIAYFSLRDTEKHIIPSPKLTITGLFDASIEAILKLMEGVMGERAIRYLPLIGTVFIYIFVCNLMSVMPFVAPPTDNINTNVPCAVVVFLYYNYMGIKEHGFRKYIGHFTGPIIWLAPLLFVIEIISHIVRPISLSVRLFGNEVGDHVVNGIFAHLVPVGIPVVFLFLALFVAFIQAFVFSLLSTVYIALATEHGEH